MYEELLLKKEKSIKTDNEMIYIEKEKDLKDKNELPILELVGHIKSGNINHLEIKKTVKKYINSYKGCV
jgi:hypothetical protein